MNPSAFWSVVATFDWTNFTGETETVKARLLREWTPEYLAEFQAAYDQVEGAMYHRFDDSGVDFDCGDDTFGDVISHIVGLGQAEYDRNMADPSLAAKRVRDSGCKNFSYCFPLYTDLEYLDPTFYTKRADDLASNLNGLTSALSRSPVVSNPKVDDCLSTLALLCGLVRDGDFTTVTSQADSFTEAAKAWPKVRETLVGTAQALRAISHLGRHLEWGSRNLVSDITIYQPGS